MPIGDRGDLAQHGPDIVGSRRRHDHDHRVRLAAGAEQLERGRERLRRGPGAQVERVAGARDHLVQPRREFGARRRHVQAGRLGRIGGQHVHAPGVADHRKTIARRQRLVGHHPRRVEQLAEVIHADDARLRAERVDRDVGRGRGCGVRSAGTLTRRRPTAHDGDDRLAARQGPPDPGEPARVAERLEIQRHRAGRRVVEPVREQIVAADIGLVAERDEARDAGTGPDRVFEHGDADGTGLGRERQTTGRRQHRRERGSQPYRRVAVEHAKAVRSDHTDAMPACDPD